MPVLQEIANSTWRKENELKDLKTEVAALDRKIHLSLKPVDTDENKQEDNSQKNHVEDLQTGSIPERLQQAKETMGDRLIIGSIPKYNNENQPKGFKL